MKSCLDRPLYNTLFTILLALVCFFLYHQSGVLEDAGMAVLVIRWIPFFFGLVTIGMYFLTRIFTKKRNWVVTVLGGLLNVVVVISAFVEGNG